MPPTLDLATFRLGHGSHSATPPGVPLSDGDACLMEAVAHFAGEPWSDHPKCASPVLTAYGIALNDRWVTRCPAMAARLVPFIPRIVGTRDGQDEVRSYLALDWLIRTYTPAWLDLAGLTLEARELRDLRRIVDLSAAQSAGPVVRSAWAAAWAAARAAAWAAAGDVAWAAAWDAAGDVAWDAAWDAAGDVAWAAAWAAAGAAAGAALNPTVLTLQESALDLFARMIDPSANPE